MERIEQLLDSGNGSITKFGFYFALLNKKRERNPTFLSLFNFFPMKIKQIDELFSCTCKFAYLRRFLRLQQNQSIQIMIKSTDPVEAPTIVHLDPDEINIC